MKILQHLESLPKKTKKPKKQQSTMIPMNLPNFYQETKWVFSRSPKYKGTIESHGSCCFDVSQLCGSSADDISEAPQSPFWTGCLATITSICNSRISVRNRKQVEMMHTNNLFPKIHMFKMSQRFNIQALQNKVFWFNSTNYKFLNISKATSLANIVKFALEDKKTFWHFP